MFGNSKYILFDVAVVISVVLMGGIALTAKRGVGVDVNDHSSRSRRARTTTTQLEQQQQPQHPEMSDADSDSDRGNSPSLSPLRRQRHRKQQEEEQEEECQNSNSQPDEHDESKSSEAPTPSTQPSNNNNSNSNSPLRRGSIVELYGSNSYFATPAWIEKQEGATSTASSTSTSATGSGYHAYTYTLHNAITSGSIPHVDSKFIHPYQIYKEGTRASCNIGLNELYLTPCVIQSHVITEEGTLVYRVSYLNQQRQKQQQRQQEDDDNMNGEEEENLVHDSLPFSKVQRKVQRNYMRGEQRTSSR